MKKHVLVLLISAIISVLVILSFSLVIANSSSNSLNLITENNAEELHIPAGFNFYNVNDAGFNLNLPADFFGPGSEPFTGIVICEGEPDLADTIIERKEDISLLPPPSQDTIPIEIIELTLVSCQPIVVSYNDSNQQQWDVRVNLPPNLPPLRPPLPLGQMTIRRTHGDGGTFTSEFPVQPLFTFTRVWDLESTNPGIGKDEHLAIWSPIFDFNAFNVSWSMCDTLDFCPDPITFNDDGSWMNLELLPTAEEEPEILCCFGDGSNDNCLLTSISQCREDGGAVMDCGLPEDIVIKLPTIQDCNEQRKQAFKECKNLKGFAKASCIMQAIQESRECKENAKDVVPTELRNFTTVAYNATDSALVNLTRDVISTGVNNSAYVNGTYDCRYFAHDLERNLTALGYNATWTTYWCYGGAGNPPATEHAVTDVHLADGRTVFIEPQTNRIINLDFDGDGIVEVNNNGYVPGQNNGQTDDNCKISVFEDRAAAAAAGVPGA